MSGTFLALLGYVVLITVIGLAIGRRVSGTSDFFVAGRAMGPGLLFATLLAANIGAGSTVGAASLGYQDGLAAWWWVGSAGIGTLILGVWIGPKLWRIAKESDLLTVGDYLEHRYGPSVRASVAILLWLVTLASLAGQLMAMAVILEVVAGAPEWLGAVAGGVVMMVYFVAGGLLSSAWVNLVQLVVLIVGFALAVPLAVQGAGGVEAVVQRVEALPDYHELLVERGVRMAPPLHPRSGLHRVAGDSAEDVRRHQRAGGPHRCPCMRLRASGLRPPTPGPGYRGAGRGAGAGSARPGLAHHPGSGRAARDRPPGPRRGPFRRDQLGRRHPLHVGHIPLEGTSTSGS